MIFSSISFLFYFLPIVLIIYFICSFLNTKCSLSKSFQNVFLLLASLLFYYYGEQQLVLVILFSTVSDYCFALIIERNRANKRIMKAVLTCSIVINLGLLGYFKYSDFFIQSINDALGISIPLLNIALPIGISFYTFQTMSYTIDVYRGDVRAQKNFINFASFVTMFFQLVAGPIIRYADISAQIEQRKHTIEAFAYGIRRFIIGLAKKVLIANTFAELCETFTYSDEKSVLFYWLAAGAFMFQIYFDFSGYSDMAIGLGRMFGFRFRENFDYPYTAKSVTEFWRRWHISLGSWFRDYVYIPLGGNRVSTFKWFRNILVVWFLTGFWHGAAWNFIAWGLFYALFLIIEKFFLKKVMDQMPSIVAHIYTLTIVIFGWLLFNANNMTEALDNIGGMFGRGGIGFTSLESVYYFKSYAFLFILACIASTPLAVRIINRIKIKEAGRKIINTLEPVFLASLLLWVTGCLIDDAFNPFIYFRF